MYVSQYDNPTVDDLTKAFEAGFSEDQIARLNKKVKDALDDQYQSFANYVADQLSNDVKDAIAQAATRMAGSLIDMALAGDEETFKAMGQYQWEWKKHHHILRASDLPLGVKLRRELLTRHHDLFEAQIVRDLEAQVEALQRRIGQLQAECARLRDGI